MRIVTWNVNSIKQRVPRLLPWLDDRRPDVVCLQETKMGDDALNELLGAELEDRGYAIAAHGVAQWNGVAILSRVGLDDVVRGLPDGPGFPGPEPRAVSAVCGGIRFVSVYVPNGRAPDSDHYRYKLEWLRALRADVAAGDPATTVVLGDMNIAPTDEDVFDPDFACTQQIAAVRGDGESARLQLGRSEHGRVARRSVGVDVNSGECGFGSSSDPQQKRASPDRCRSAPQIKCSAVGSAPNRLCPRPRSGANAAACPARWRVPSLSRV